MTIIQESRRLKSDMAEDCLRLAADRRADSALIRREGSGTIATPGHRVISLFEAAVSNAQASLLLSELAHDLRTEKRPDDAKRLDSRAKEARDQALADLKDAAATVVPTGDRHIAALFND